MRKILFFILLYLSVTCLHAQVTKKEKANYHHLTGQANKGIAQESPSIATPLSNRPVPLNAHNNNRSSSAITAIPLGSSGNVYTIIQGESNMVAASNTLNTVVFVHRGGAQLGDPTNGQYRYDISKDGGSTWTNNVGPFGQGSDAVTICGRYPQAVLHNPAGNTTADNAYISYLGTYHNCNTGNAVWDGYITGVGKLDNSNNTETIQTYNNADVLIAKSMANGLPGEFWTIDYAYDGTNSNAVLVLKGTYNSSTNDVEWVEALSLDPGFDVSFDNTPKITSGAIAFDPTGQYGWIAFAADVMSSTQSANVYNPVFYKTTDGGATWSTTEIAVNLADFCSVSDNMPVDSFGNSIPPTTAFNIDLAVDKNGHPHLFTLVAGGSDYSILSGNWKGLFDITYDGTQWHADLISQVLTFRGTFYGLVEDNRPQATRTEDGTKIFVTWLDSDTTNNPALDNKNPNLLGRGLDITTGMMTPVVNFTKGDPNWDGKALYASIAPTVLGTSGTYTIPTVVTVMNDTDLNPKDFFYFSDVAFNDADFSIEMLAGADFNYTPTCLGDSTYFTSMLNSGSAAYWYWDFDDDSISYDQNPVHLYDNAGAYNVTLFIYDSTGGCVSVTRQVGVAGAPPVASFTAQLACVNQNTNFTDNSTNFPSDWLWNLGDGTIDSTQNPSHLYSTTGDFVVSLTVSNSCPGLPSTYIDTVTVNPSPVITDFSADSISTMTNSTIQFTGNTTGADSWLWNLGDGKTDTAQNPTHAYTSVSGSPYTVTLVAYNSFGCTDTLAKTGYITVISGMKEQLFNNNARLSIFPNPSNDVFNIQYSISVPAAKVNLSIYNLLGEKLAELVNERQMQGEYAFHWANQYNTSESAYFCVLNVDGKHSVATLIHVK